jgi:hypothetical protein
MFSSAISGGILDEYMESKEDISQRNVPIFVSHGVKDDMAPISKAKKKVDLQLLLSCTHSSIGGISERKGRERCYL